MFTLTCHFVMKTMQLTGSKGIPCLSNGQNDLSYTQTNVIMPISNVETVCTWNLQVANLCTLIVTVKVGLIYRTIQCKQ